MQQRAKTDPWSPFKERVAVALWAAFLIGIVETGAFFSYIDPWRLDHVPYWLLLDAWAIYGVIFLFFWACTFLATALTAYMLGSGLHSQLQNDTDRS